MHKILFCNKFIICLYMFRALCAHHQEVKIVLYSIWYRHNCVGGRPVHRLGDDSCAPDGHLQVWWHQIMYNTYFFYVLLTVHLSIFSSVFNQLDAQNLFHNKFYFMTLHVSSTMCLSSEGQNYITQHLASSHWNKWVVLLVAVCALVERVPSLNPCTRRPPIGPLICFSVMIPEAV